MLAVSTPWGEELYQNIVKFCKSIHKIIGSQNDNTVFNFIWCYFGWTCVFGFWVLNDNDVALSKDSDKEEG